MISTPPDIHTDLHGLSRLRELTREDTGKGLDIVARQFEALFLQMMLKSVRESSFGDPLFGSQQTDFYQEMYDKQLSVDLAHKGGMGIADMLVEQLGKQLLPKKKGGDEDEPSLPVQTARLAPVPPIREPAAAPVTELQPSRQPSTFRSPAEFVKQLWPDASRAATELGVSPRVLLAQAALETGWGGKIIQQEQRGSSYNLFNIKADRSWNGEKALLTTLEHVDGNMVRQRAAFRAYGSYAESFADYVDFLRTNPRYGAALLKTGDDRAFVEALHGAGYATDPQYADKVWRVMQSRVMAEAVDAVKFPVPEPILSYKAVLARESK